MLTKKLRQRSQLVCPGSQIWSSDEELGSLVPITPPPQSLASGFSDPQSFKIKPCRSQAVLGLGCGQSARGPGLCPGPQDGLTEPAGGSPSAALAAGGEDPQLTPQAPGLRRLGDEERSECSPSPTQGPMGILRRQREGQREDEEERSGWQGRWGWVGREVGKSLEESEG